jgi:hypothetical protein
VTVYELNPLDALVAPEAQPTTLPSWAVRAVTDHDFTLLRDYVIEHCTSVVFPENRHDPMFVESLAASVSENVHALRDVIAGVLGIADVPLVHRLRFAAVEAELRVPQASLQRSYRISFFLQAQEWSRVLARAAEAEDVDRDEALAAVATLNRVVHLYSDSVISNVAMSFARSEDALTRSRAHVRQRLVREILSGNDEVLSPADLLTLDYALASWHLAVFLPETPQGAAGQLLVGLRAAVRPMHSLVYPVRLGSSVIWLGSNTRWTEGRVQRVVDLLETAGVAASVSDTAAELPGFLRTFEQVGQVEEVRSSARQLELPSVITYSELRLEILLLQSPALARDFLVQELGPLAEDTVDAGKLRATLEASFRLGSHVATAEFLELHEHTVRNRLQKAHDLLGPLHERRTEIQVALRLWRMLDRG